MLAVAVVLHLMVQAAQVVVAVAVQVAQITQQLYPYRGLRKLAVAVVAQKETALLLAGQAGLVSLLFATQIHYLRRHLQQVLLQLPLLGGIVFISGLFPAQLRSKDNYESLCKSRKWDCYAGYCGRAGCD
jgi:hypothetical protein